MSRQTVLPDIMVAPNGARRTKADHPAIPISDDELIATARACFDAGAHGLHAHIRDEDGAHLLDAGRYRALLDQLNEAVPDMFIQVTSEAAGRYDPDAQRRMIKELRPASVSVALREMVLNDDWKTAQDFYAWAAEAGVEIQHIVYSIGELDRFIAAVDQKRLPGSHHLLQLVLGTYDGSQVSQAEDVQLFVTRMQQSDYSYDWMLCAFGREETDCLVEAHKLGGKMRIGFENSLWHSDGRLAKDNADRIAELKSALTQIDQ